jgi:homoserine dehydrogenase
LKEKQIRFKADFNFHFKLVAIFEHDGALIDDEGIDLEILLKDEKNLRANQLWANNVKAEEIIPSLKIDILIETTPTNPITGEPALTHIIQAIKHKINVISSNKAPFFLQYEKISKLADQMGCLVKYEATVSSCVPILSIKKNLAGNTITRVRAILNGTTNYILSRMTAEKIPFSVALKEAQELGYAETDPSLDINGYDAAGKLVILSNELLGWAKSIKDVKIEGITKITQHALELAKSDGYVIKHLAIAEENELTVKPRLIKRESPLNIQGTLNIIELQTKHTGSINLMGKGAGGFEAASAILNDLINIAEEMDSN